jgi:hypothetical protein
MAMREFAALHAQRLADKMVEERMPIEEECQKWLDTEDFGYSYHFHIMKNGAKLGIDWFLSRTKGESK